jgi:hypothetical protein
MTGILVTQMHEFGISEAEYGIMLLGTLRYLFPNAFIQFMSYNVDFSGLFNEFQFMSYDITNQYAIGELFCIAWFILCTAGLVAFTQDLDNFKDIRSLNHWTPFFAICITAFVGFPQNVTDVNGRLVMLIVAANIFYVTVTEIIFNTGHTHPPAIWNRLPVVMFILSAILANVVESSELNMNKDTLQRMFIILNLVFTLMYVSYWTVCIIVQLRKVLRIRVFHVVAKTEDMVDKKHTVKYDKVGL